jgi:predicted O-linked N-acetylglucosamine transferase (SPINDLY family)
MDRWYVAQEFADRPRPRGDRIRIGIVSADVRMHSVWMAIIKGWLEHANRVRFEVGVFCLNTRQDAVTNWARSHSDFFVAGPKSLYRWVDAIRTENPDVLLFPAVGLEELTLQLASLRLAAVQMNAWGHPETSGLPTIDYYLSGESFEPAQAQKNYTEQLVLLPHLGNTYEALRVPGTEADLRGLGIDPERPIVLCPGSPFKYQPEYDPIFIEVARRVTCCQFVFFNADPPDISNRLRARLVAAFAQAEMSFDTHGCFIPRQSIPEYHALLKRADVLMDTIGFSGYNNVVQALECGLPVVTREGRFLRGRLGSGVLRCAGLTELIAETEGEYVDLAARLLLDPVYRESVRRKIVEQRGILFDDVTPMRRLEALLESAVAKHAIQ